jgi:hypothetical protein
MLLDYVRVQCDSLPVSRVRGRGGDGMRRSTTRFGRDGCHSFFLFFLLNQYS